MLTMEVIEILLMMSDDDGDDDDDDDDGVDGNDDNDYVYDSILLHVRYPKFRYNCIDQRDSENVSDDDDSSSSSDSEKSHGVGQDIEGEETAVVRLSWKPSGGPVCLGEWEQHTKVSHIFLGKNIMSDKCFRLIILITC